jgi:cytochrome c-type biogenesis protein CcmH/NrfG
MQVEMDAIPVERSAAADSLLSPWRVYSMAAIYLIAGLATGYVLRMSQSPATRPAAASVPAAPHTMAGAAASAKPPTLDQMKQMADDRAKPLLEKLKSDPNNPFLLLQVGAAYHAAHRFQEAAAYFGKAVESDPKNTAARTKLAISLYREGDVDGALAQLNRALQDSQGDANALFNLGMIRLQGKQDGAGAIAAWQQLLKLNPQMSKDRQAEVQNLMAEVETSLGKQSRNERTRNPGSQNQ